MTEAVLRGLRACRLDPLHWESAGEPHAAKSMLRAGRGASTRRSVLRTDSLGLLDFVAPSQNSLRALGRAPDRCDESVDEARKRAATKSSKPRRLATSAAACPDTTLQTRGWCSTPQYRLPPATDDDLRSSPAGWDHSEAGTGSRVRAAALASAGVRARRHSPRAA